MPQRFSLKYIVLLALLVVFFIVDLVSGAVILPISKVLGVFGSHADVNTTIIVLGLRLPKAITALCAGAGLSVAGLLMQTFFRNPLAGPYVLGVNSLASLSVATFLIADVGSFSLFHKLGIPFCACLGSFIGMLILLALSRRVKDNTHLLLVGMMIGFLAGALQSMLEYVSNAQQLKNFVIWNMASFSNTGDLSELKIFLFVVLGSFISCLFLVKPLNAMLLGDDQAKLLGVNVTVIKVVILILVAVLSGVTTAYCGPVGFIGLAMPHLVRVIFKTTHHLHQLFGCILVGACFTLFCDIVGNLPFLEMTIPVNVITSLFGAPFVLWMIFRNKAGLE